MAIHRLLIEEIDDVDYQLLAIHSTIEDYRLAFFINKNLTINLSKTSEDISIHENKREINFSRFIYNDDDNNLFWDLFQNKSQDDQGTETINTGLFSDSTLQVSTKTYLLPEFKRVDYFLKVDKSFTEERIQKTISKLKKIQKVSTVYSIDAEKIKSKNNLIF
jgi:hypothetical protein